MGRRRWKYVLAMKKENDDDSSKKYTIDMYGWRECDGITGAL